jgi:hypothetical protein
MLRIVCLLLLACVISCPVFTRQGGLDHLSGIVLSENGLPIEGVKVFAWKDATTDAEGRFELPDLPSKDSVVYFQKEGFRPKSLIVKTQTSTVKVVLEDDRKTAWFITACLARDIKGSPEGAQLEFLLPKNAKVRRIKDIDYQEYVVSLVKGSKPLQLWYGPLVSPGWTVSELTLRSASFEERSIHSKSGQLIGYDRRGKTQDGMVWRSADFPGLSASAIYEAVSGEEAATYDRIIDSACQPEQSH